MGLVSDAINTGASNSSRQLTYGTAIANLAGLSTEEIVQATLYDPTLFGNDVTTSTLSGYELWKFASWYNAQFVIPTQESDLRAFFDARFAQALLALLRVKKTLNNGGLVFGSYPKGSVYANPIRPETVYANGASVISTWQQASVTEGWNAAFWTINLNLTNAKIILNTQNSVEMIIFGFADMDASPKLYSVLPKQNGQTPIGVREYPLMFAKSNQQIKLFEQCIEIPTNNNYTFDVKFESSGSSEPIPIGIQFETAKYYQATSS